MATTNKKIIPIEVRGEYILSSGVSIGAMGSFDATVLQATFDESWVGLTKYATWTDALGNVGEQILFTELDRAEDTSTYTYNITVPAFPLRHAGTVKLSFTGYVVDGDKIRSVMNTATGTFRVLESNAIRIRDDGVDASIAEQLQSTEAKLAASAFELNEKLEEFEIAELERDEAENGYTDINGDVVFGRVQNEKARKTAEGERKTAEEQRQINEFGAVGNYYDEGEDVVRDSDGVAVSNALGGRVGAEIQRRLDEAERISNENVRKQNETVRKDNEIERVAKENTRITNEEVREKKMRIFEALIGQIGAVADAILEKQESYIGGDA